MSSVSAPQAPLDAAAPVFFVLLGASNLAFAFPGMARELAARFRGRRLSIYAARGCGRSYGLIAGVPGFSTPGLSRCGLFAALESDARAAGKAEVHALLTDIGNDILYGAGAEQTARWVAEIAGRLLLLGGRIAVTSLPVASVEAMPAWKYRLLRPLFYPFRPVEQAAVLRQVRELQERLEKLGEEQGFKVLPTRSSWYSFDHFHLRRGLRHVAFSTWLDQLLGAEQPSRQSAADDETALTSSHRALRYHSPAEYFLFGRSRRRLQPGTAIAPGVRLYCY